MAKKVEFNLATVKKYAFWVCAPIGLVVAVLMGMMAVTGVGGKLEDRKKQLDSQKTAIEGLKGGASSHPNQGTIDEINVKRDELAKIIFTAWETLEKDQRERNRWEGLADKAIRDIEHKNFLDPLEPATLTSYLNFQRDEIKKLIDKANISRCRSYIRYRDGREEPLETNEPLLTSDSNIAGGSGGVFSTRSADMSGSSPGAPVGVTVTKGKVVWDKQIVITMKNWERQPQPFEVWLTQEDLWVYQALLWVVAESNKDVREASRVATAGTVGMSGTMGAKPLDLSASVIKQIVSMSIGKKAASALASQSKRRVGSPSSGSEGEYGGDSSSSGSYSGGSDESGDGAGMGPEAAKSAAMTGRYVDDTGTPLPDVDLTGQFRRMPIYLNLVVDQRRVTDVLANCANCPMPIDVLWVTINPDATSAFEFASASGTTGMDSEYSSGSSMNSRAARTTSASSLTGGIIGLSGGTSGQGMGGTNDIDFGTDAINIKIYGCINIFAPPDVKKITGESAGE